MARLAWGLAQRCRLTPRGNGIRRLGRLWKRRIETRVPMTRNATLRCWNLTGMANFCMPVDVVRSDTSRAVCLQYLPRTHR